MTLPWGSTRTRTVAILLALVLLGEQVALAANGPLLAVIAAVAQIALALVALVLLQPPAAFWRPAAPVLLLLSAAISWVALHPIVGDGLPDRSPAPDLIEPGLVRLFGLTAMLLTAGWTGYRRGLMRIAVGWIVAFGVVQIAIGLILRQLDPARVWGYDKGLLADRFTGTSLNANASGCLFGVIALLALGRWLALLRTGDGGRVNGVFDRTMAALALFAGVGACAITGSRTALALTLVTLAALAISDRPLRRFLFSPTGLLLSAGALIGVGLLFFLVGDVTFDRLAMTGTDALGRVEIWSHYAAVVARSPVWGYGLQSFDEVNLRSLHTIHDATMLWYIHSPHNMVLSLLIEGGLPYSLLLAATVLAILLAIARRRGSDRQDPLLRSVLAAVGLIAACSMVDIALDVPAIAALAVTLLGMPWGRAIRQHVDHHLLDPHCRSAGALEPISNEPR